MSSSERQRRFIERNPGYDARRKAAQREAEKRGVAILKAQVQAETAAAMALEQRKPLLLPAPVETIPLLLRRPEEREAVLVSRFSDAA